MTFICHGEPAAPDEALRVLVGLATCCAGAALDGPQECTCWEIIYDLDQHPVVDETARPGVRDEMCTDCAYRPDSPERSGDDRYANNDGELDAILAQGETFWCHQGIRKPVRFRHPLGIEIEATADHYKPLMVVIGGEAVPFRADGTPAERCAGWAARRRALGAIAADVAAMADD